MDKRTKVWVIISWICTVATMVMDIISCCNGKPAGWFHVFVQWFMFFLVYGAWTYFLFHIEKIEEVDKDGM